MIDWLSDRLRRWFLDAKFLHELGEETKEAWRVAEEHDRSLTNRLNRAAFARDMPSHERRKRGIHDES